MFKLVMVKQKNKPTKKINHRIAIGSMLVLLVLLLGISWPIVRADKFDEQINAINVDNTQKQAAADNLGQQATSLSDKIAKLQSQIGTLEAQIRDNNAKNDELQLQIKNAEEELAKQRKLLGENIKAMYLEGEISTLEMLASSKDLSEFVDKQQYRDVVKSKIKGTLDRVVALKLELKEQKLALEKLIKDETAMQTQLDSERAENDHLLALTKDQQTQIDTQIKDNIAKVASLRQQQAVENAKLFIGGIPKGEPGGGGYPGGWAFAAQDTIIDSWGMWNRECVSFTAWKVWSSGRHMPYWGNIPADAKYWDDNARAAGIPVDGSPRVGDVAISNGGQYGHAMYVEAVNGDGTVIVSQYNAFLDGTYSVGKVYAANLSFIHF